MPDHTDVLVTSHGSLQFTPLLAAISRELAPATYTPIRRHAGVDIVCMVLAGALRYEPASGPLATLVAEDVGVLRTGTGTEYRWRALGDEPVRAVMLWMLGRSDGKPAIDVRMASRIERIGELAPIAGHNTPLPVSHHVRVMASVLAVGESLMHTARGKRYVMSTIGAFCADGIEAAAGDGVLLERRGAVRISARESTEVVIVETS
jgi:redox-sensitive bicupin YhaK (pirin superfamily)